MPRSCDDPDGTLDTRLGVSSGAGFSILLVDLLPHLNNYGAISTFRRLRAALWPVWFPVYASTVLFPHPSAITASGFMLFTRCLPRSSNGLANTTATLGSYYWLGIITSGLTPDKKRLAWLGAQRQRNGAPGSTPNLIRRLPRRRHLRLVHPLLFRTTGKCCLMIDQKNRAKTRRKPSIQAQPETLRRLSTTRAITCAEDSAETQRRIWISRFSML